MIVETKKLKEIWGRRPKTGEERNLEWGDWVASEISAGIRHYNKEIQESYVVSEDESRGKICI